VNTDALRARREAIVREHAEAENQHEFGIALDSFHHPRYELMPLGEVIDGAEAVAAYYRETREAFPDQRNRIIALHHSDDVVLMELELTGTHLGSFRGLRPPVARSAAGWPRSSSSTATGCSASASTSTRPRSCGSSGWHTIRSPSRAVWRPW